MNPPPISRRFALRLVLCWLGTVAVFEPLARAHDPSIGFHLRASYPVPDFSQPGTFIRGPVIYNLPDPATSASIYAGPANSYLDVFVDVNHGTEMAAGFGVIMLLDGNGKVTFEPDPINLDHPDPPNNIPYAQRTDFPRNTSFEIMFANPDVFGFPPGHTSVSVVGLYPVPNQDTPVNDSEGIFAMSIRAQAGATGFVEASFILSQEFTGFVTSTGHVYSNDPTRSGVIEVRASVPGDMNGDGAADADDVAGFVAALVDRSAFIAEFPWLQTDYIADFNEDHLITLADVPGFEAACGCDAGLEPMPGDINGDGHVDRMDAAQFIAQFGALGEGVAPAPANGGAMLGDFDQDGVIGAADLVILQSHIGQSMSFPSPLAHSSPAAIPEPSSLLFVLATIVLVGLARRRYHPCLAPAPVDGR